MAVQAKRPAVLVGQTPIRRVVYPVGADRLTRYAAADCRKYLRQSVGFRGRVGEGRPSAGAIFVASVEDFPECAAYFQAAPAGQFDRTVIDIRDGRVCLIGENRLSALYAVYDFLQLYLGIRFYAPGACHEYIPALSGVEIMAPNTFYHGSDFEIRDFVNRTNDPEVFSFAVKNRINSILGCGPWVNGSDQCSVENAAMIHAFGLKVRGPGHSWKHFVPEASLFPAHPEYFPMRDGRRIVNHRTACFSNPEARRIFLDNLRQYLRRHPYWDIFAFWAEDGQLGSFCDCEQCRQRSVTDWYIHLVNEAAEILEQEHPQALFELIVYQGTAVPPTQMKNLHRDGENMLVNICLGQSRDLFHPLAERTYGSAGVMDTYRRWRQYLSGIGYRGRILLMEYYNLCEQPNSGPAGRGLLWPLAVIRDDIRFYRDEGLSGLGAFTGFDRLGWPSPFNLWAWLRLWSHSDEEIDRLKDDFYPKYFGRFGALARQSMEELEACMYAPASPENIAALERLPSVSLFSDDRPAFRMKVLKLHQEFCLLLKKMFLAYQQNDFPAWERLRPAYVSFFDEHRADLDQVMRPYPPLWHQHWLGHLPWNGGNVGKDMSSDSFKMLR